MDSILDHDDDEIFVFYNASKEDAVKIRKRQVTAERLAIMFNLESSTVFLVEDGTGSTEWPGDDGRFDLSSIFYLGYMRVAGRPRNQMNAAMSMPQLQNRNSGFSSLFRSSKPASTAQAVSLPPSKKQKVVKYSLKVTLAELERNKIVNQSRQKYIMIAEDSADVGSITKACRKEFDDETLVIVSSNGLSIEDSEATRGLSFWKSNSRRIFAVPMKRAKSEPEVVNIEDDEKKDEKLNNLMTKIKDDIIENTNQEMSQHFNEIKQSVVDIKADLHTLAMFESTKLILEIGKELQCIICKYVIEPPAVFANCCGKILGCETCITPAVATTRACPNCRNHDTEGIHIVRGLEFLSQLKTEISKSDGI
ncbi:hypothetical protein AC249_AIPGENE15203 [Paramuricea clavata]|uniref:Uncharacterized protein n=1 Tax=Paramuricea clavata TaxID=317549 RepID=A0A6S7H208_PARCT|nr:hypothetical protein AC249_AIPGENE15203 [Paramuricea clavata]